MTFYKRPGGVKLLKQRNRIHLRTTEGGQVAIDRRVAVLWQAADHLSQADLLEEFTRLKIDSLQARAGLACLAEAGLLQRNLPGSPLPSVEKTSGELVSVIIVSYNSLEWLPTCLASLSNQSYSPVEIILVDNASQDGSADWVARHWPAARLIRLEQPRSLAQAINTGLQLGQGGYFLLLNPDVRLQPQAIGAMVQIAASYPNCAAVAAKLRLQWTPSFLNGLGNLAGAFSWGTDLGLGHLDLGQFDRLRQLPSACFAAALIPAWALNAVGLLDEGYPMYYEDMDWCYRARLYGFTICAAPQAIIEHAFSARLPSEHTPALAPRKLRRVTGGRLRWITHINGTGYLLRFLINYFLEDLGRILFYLLTFHPKMMWAILAGWDDFRRMGFELLQGRKNIQSRRKISDRELYHLQHSAPVPLIHSGHPQLTWDVICNEYLPLILAGKTRSLPEFENLPLDFRNSQNPPGLLRRIAGVWREQGGRALMLWLGRRMQWRLMKP